MTGVKGKSGRPKGSLGKKKRQTLEMQEQKQVESEVAQEEKIIEAQ